jgi:hypothetical protein
MGILVAENVSAKGLLINSSDAMTILISWKIAILGEYSMRNTLARRGLAATFAAVSLFAAQAVSADQIQLASFWGGNTWDASITFNGTNYHDGSAASFTEGGGAGGFLTKDLTTGTSFQSWCVDIFHDFNFPVTTTDIKTSAASIFGQTKATDLGRLYTYVESQGVNVDGHNSSNTDAAAFQLAVWEVVNETAGTNYNLSSGNLSITGTGVAEAQGWLDYLNSNPYSANSYAASIWSVQGQGASGWGAQDVAVFAPIPEPETYAMLLAGLGLLGFMARRRKQKDTAA